MRGYSMIYSFSLKTMMLAVGLALFLSHLLALVKGPAVKAWLKGFPRDKSAGVILTILLAVWFYWLVKTSDLGEFSNWRGLVLYLTPVSALLAIFFMQEFLAVRALGGLVLMAAEPILESAFLRDESSRLLLVSLTYVWILVAMFWVGMPFTLRNQIAWVSASDSRWRSATYAGLAYGALLSVCGFLL